MILTEADARQKWCPFVRFHGVPTDDSISNREGMFDNAPLCIGSGCMAWRTQEQSALVPVHASAETVPDWEAGGYTKGAQSGDGRWLMNPPKQTVEPKGYCGLAGQP